MKHILLVISVFILVACSPSDAAIQTAMAQTQLANPTSTSTETIPPTITHTPTITNTSTPSITPSSTLTPTPMATPVDLVMVFQKYGFSRDEGSDYLCYSPCKTYSLSDGTMQVATYSSGKITIDFLMTTELTKNKNILSLLLTEIYPAEINDFITNYFSDDSQYHKIIDQTVGTHNVSISYAGGFKLCEIVIPFP